jgi:hypothetical protein
MANVRIPSWFNRISTPSFKPPFIDFTRRRFSGTEEQAFWNEQVLRFGFNPEAIKEEIAYDNASKSFILQNYFESLCESCKWNSKLFSPEEQAFWSTWGTHIEALHIRASFIQSTEFLAIMRFVPHLKILAISGCANLFKYSEHTFLASILQQQTHLKKIVLQEVENIEYDLTEILPKSITHIQLIRCRILPKGLLKEAKQLINLHNVCVRFCPELRDIHVHAIPKWVSALDLTGSFKSLSRDCLFFLPSELEVCKLNHWHHMEDNDIHSLPKTLQELEIDGWNLSHIGLRNFSRFTNLKKLSLQECSDDGYFEEISLLPKSLVSCNLSSNRINVYDLPHLKNLINLETLIMEGCDLSSSPKNAESDFLPENIKELFITHSKHLKIMAMENLLALSKLEKLKLTNCHVHNDDICEIPKGIKSLDVSFSKELSDLGIEHLKEHSHLETLILDGCGEIRGQCFTFLPKSLKRLYLNGCDRCSGKSLKDLPKELLELQIEHGDLIESNDINTLSSNLQCIDLSHCKNIDNQVFERIAIMPLLHTVYMQGCEKIDEIGLRALMASDFMGIVHLGSSKEEFLKIKKVRSKKVIDNSIEVHPSLTILKKTLCNSGSKRKDQLPLARFQTFEMSEVELE